jgi:hypothetical protein
MADETIGDWTVEKLVRFLQQALEENPPSRIPSLTCDTLIVQGQAIMIDQVQFTQQQVTVGAAGAASAPPATPTGYLRILDYTGQPFVIPYYKAN